MKKIAKKSPAKSTDEGLRLLVNSDNTSDALAEIAEELEVLYMALEAADDLEDNRQNAMIGVLCRTQIKLSQVRRMMGGEA